jgi:hypothetical protein
VSREKFLQNFVHVGVKRQACKRGEALHMRQKALSVARMCSVTEAMDRQTFNRIHVFERDVVLHGHSEVNVPFCLQLCATLESSVVTIMSIF